jgi:hypothetical protein
MEEHIREVMSTGIEPEQLAIEHVRNTRQGMPVSGMKMGKYSNHAIECDALDDARILVNVNVVIEIDEIVPECLPKDQPGDCDQSEADAKRREP